MLHASEMTADLDVNDVEAYLGARDIATSRGRTWSHGILEVGTLSSVLHGPVPARRPCTVRRGEGSRMGRIAKLIRDIVPGSNFSAIMSSSAAPSRAGTAGCARILRDLASSHLHQSALAATVFAGASTGS